MVECKFLLLIVYSFAATVLIDTWWNVNSEEEDRDVKDPDGFNRYMVECK